MKMQDLEDYFNEAMEEDYKYVGVLVKIKDNESLELIVNSEESFKEKLEYYKNTYNENLEHKYADGISIVKIAKGDWLGELEEKLFNIKILGVESIKIIPTTRLVNELKERKEVNTYTAYTNDKYNIEVENIGSSEEDKITTIRNNRGPCTILEVMI